MTKPNLKISSISIHAPSRERRNAPVFGLGTDVISIHAPSRERHRRLTFVALSLIISIHAPSRERHFVKRLCCNAITFQSTLPRGSDRMFLDLRFLSRDFNPRSLAGATLRCCRAVMAMARFQSTLPRGSDYWLSNSTASDFLFQSTLPRGSDNIPEAYAGRRNDFNPRSLAGATSNLTLISLRLLLFQSTLPRGSDAGPGHRQQRDMDFNPRSLAGATERRNQGKFQTYFNPRSLAGATRTETSCKALHQYFNPRSLAGATRKLCIAVNARSDFNPRSLAGATD